MQENKTGSVKIEKGVPIPSRIASRVRVGNLPLGELDVGDSILVECTDEEKNRVIHSLRVRLGRFTKKEPDFKFSSTKVQGGIRIWRK
jgi:hypothetical protein